MSLFKYNYPNKKKKIYKVLIKGAWQGEADSTIFADDVGGQVNEDGNLYAICHYENGERKYHSIPKKMYENYDEIGSIMTNPNLSEEQRAEKVKKIMND